MEEKSELRASSPFDTATLRKFIMAAVQTSQGYGSDAGGVMAVGRPNGRRPLRIVVGPMAARRLALGPEPAAAVLFVTDPDRTPVPAVDDIRTLFGLTTGEARLARALVDGLDLEQAAARLGLRVGTVRTRLQSIFEKTGSHRQADLVRRILTASAAYP
jgi:DNA-binding CsgD family transcriptional regulator